MASGRMEKQIEHLVGDLIVPGLLVAGSVAVHLVPGRGGWELAPDSHRNRSHPQAVKGKPPRLV